MSLPVLANHLASRGRGDDSVLVHMTPGEVKGLQSLAMAHGGSLSVNPDTGLPEAGFLKSILPAVLGMALAPMTAGTSLAFLGTPMAAGLAVGGLGALATGSLKEGLMMGLGAFGGAGMGAALSGAGTGAISSAAGADIAALPTASTAEIAGAGAGASAGVPTPPAVTPPHPDFGYGMFTEPPPASATGFGSSTGAGFGGVPPTVAAPPASVSATDPYFLESAQQRAVEGALGKTTPMQTMQAGVGEALKNPSQFMTKDNLKYGLAAMAPAMFATPEVKMPGDESEAMIRPYRFDPYGGQYTRLTPYPASQSNTRFAEGGDTSEASEAETPAELHRRIVAQAYGNIGRTGFGTAPSNVDQAGFDYWMNTLESGAATPETFQQGFDTAVQNYLQTKPDDPVSKYVSGQLEQQQARVNPPPRTPTNQYDRLTGDSAAAYDYLMGGGAYPMRTTQPRVFAPYAESVLGIASDPTTQKYVWDAARGQYQVNPGYAPPAPVVDKKAAGAAGQATTGESGGGASDVGGRGGDYGVGSDGFGGDYGVGLAPGGIVALARGGMESHLGDYSDGGRLLKGPGDGVSDSIPATIANKRPARLADGEFVVPARIVSELGNGSTEAGARKLYAMMDRIQKRRSKTVGKGKVAVNSRAEKMLPA